MMIVFGGNTHNDTSHSFGAKCYSNELLSYDVLCDAWHYMTIPHDLRDSQFLRSIDLIIMVVYLF